MAVTVVSDWIGGQNDVREDDSGLYASRSFLVIGATGTASTHLYLAMQVTGVPGIGDAHPATGTLKCNGLQPRVQNRDGGLVEVVASYFRPDSDDWDPDNPATTDPTFIANRFELQQYGELVNATGGSISKRFIDRPVQVWTVERSVSGYIEDLNETYAGRVNSVAAKFQSSAATGWPVHTLRCEGFEGEIVAGRTVNRITGTFSLSGRWDVAAWGWRFPNEATGYEELYEEVNFITSGYMVSAV